MADRLHIPEVIEPDSALPRDLVALRAFARLMDEAFVIPGTKRRFGIDALVGLIPGVGDVIAALMSTWIVAGALRHRVPFRVITRMAFNIAADALLGAIPVAGDVFDFLFEENVANMRLLEKHRDRRRPPRSTASIALIVIAIAVLIMVVPLGLLALLTAWVLNSAGLL